MFLICKTSYRGSEQVSKGQYLAAFSDPHDTYVDAATGKTFERVYCCVRNVTLRQCGHWMMGKLRIAGHSFSLSGGFGHDGLPLNFRAMKKVEGKWTTYSLTPGDIAKVKAKCVVMPEALSTKYWVSSGHNEVGPMSSEIREWAKLNCTGK